MKVCVLLPDYSTSNVDYQHYDPPRDLSRLLPGDTVHHVSINKLTTYRQLRGLARENYDIFVNLCEGYLDWDTPSIDVIHSLDALNLPYTGPPAHLYDPPKTLMKYVAYTAGVRTPAYRLARNEMEARTAGEQLQFPLFVKPSHAGDSLGIDNASLVQNKNDLLSKVNATLPEHDEVLIEEFVDGREFTVLVMGGADPHAECSALAPVEYRFIEGRSFKTYALKTSEMHPEANVPVLEEPLCSELQQAARGIFQAFGGVGYARLDFRMNARHELYFLEINFTCSVFYSDGYEGSADHILKYDGMSQAGFLRHIIAEGIARWERKQKPYRVQGNGVAGYGIFATRALAVGDLIFRGEEQAHRLVTARHVKTQWRAGALRDFRRYALPVGSDTYAMWSENPLDWAPQNHSCNPNTAYHGLNVAITRTVSTGEELTLDYGPLMNEESEPFDCSCGSTNCRGVIEPGGSGGGVAK